MCLLTEFMGFTTKVQLIPGKKMIISQVCNVLIKPPRLEISLLEKVHTYS